MTTAYETTSMYETMRIDRMNSKCQARRQVGKEQMALQDGGKVGRKGWPGPRNTKSPKRERKKKGKKRKERKKRRCR